MSGTQGAALYVKPNFFFFGSFFSLLGLMSAALAIVPEGVSLSLRKAVVSRFLYLVALTIIRKFASVIKAVNRYIQALNA